MQSRVARNTARTNGSNAKKKKAKLELCRMTWRTGSQSHKTDEKGKKEKYLVTKKRKNSHVRCAE